MKSSNYIPNISRGRRVRFVGEGQDRRTGQLCNVIGILPNPSMHADKQWYDVRFDDGTIGRFLERYLVLPDANEETNAA